MNHSIGSGKIGTGKIRLKLITGGILLLGMASILSSPVQAADAENGKALHEAKCQGCHDTRMYTRKNRIVHTYEDLHSRVQFCDGASNAGFTLEDIDDVVAYLNKEFYKFKQ